MRTLLLLLFIPAAVVYLPAQGWQAGPSLPTGGAAREYAAGVSAGGDVFALGGTPFTPGGDGVTHQLVSGTAAWSSPAPTENALFHIGAAVDGLGRIIVIGGEDANGDPGEPYVWTPQDGNDGGIAQRSSGAPAKLFAVAVDVLGRIYVLGGGAGAAPTPAEPNTALVERYEAGTDTWTVLASMPSAVADAAACGDGQGSIYVLGGFDASGTRTAGVAVYDVAAGTWSDTAVPDMPAPRSGLRAVFGSDGRLYAVGGSDGVASAGTFVYDPGAGVWSTGPSMAVAREHFACVVGPDDHVWAMGGRNAAGGTSTVERLFTPPCPQVVVPPAATEAYAGTAFELTVGVAGGPPLSYQWRRDGSLLSDGLSVGGGTIAGALTERLTLVGVGTADSGDYDCVVTNACGTTVSPAATVTVRPPPAVPAAFGVVRLHPAGSTSSAAYAVDGGLAGGSTGYTHPTHGQLSHPAVWSVAGGPAATLTPTGSAGGAVVALREGTAAGWWWWPYTTPQGTGYHRNACAWTTPSAAGHVQLQPSGWEYGSCSDTDGTHHVGTLRYDDSSTNTDGHYWPSSSTFAHKLTPAAAWGSSTSAIAGGRQFGSVHHGYGVVHAAMWEGSAATHTDLNPAGSSWSYVLGAGSGQQVGRATFGGVHGAGLWAGSAATFVSLHPAAAGQSEAYACEGGLQVGRATTPGGSHAMLWTGSAASAVDLHSFLPASFVSSEARDVDVDATGVITIAGSGYDGQTGRTEAILWRGAATSFSQSVSEVSLGAGGTVHMSLGAGPAWAGEPYVLLGSLSGTSPGIDLTPTVNLPLNYDAYLTFMLDFPDTVVVPSIGTLDASGFATATAVVPASSVPLPASFTVHHAYVVLGSGGSLFTSDAAALTIVP